MYLRNGGRFVYVDIVGSIDYVELTHFGTYTTMQVVCLLQAAVGPNFLSQYLYSQMEAV